MPDWTLSSVLQSGGLTNGLRALSRYGSGQEADHAIANEYRGISSTVTSAVLGFASAAAAAAVVIDALTPGAGIPFNDVPISPIDDENTVTINTVAEVKNKTTGQTMRRPVIAKFDVNDVPTDLDAYLKKLIRDYWKQKYPEATTGKQTDVSYQIYSATRGQPA